MLVVVVLFVVSCFAGLGFYSGGARNSGGETNSPTAAPTANDEGVPDRVVAVVDGERITLSRIETEMFEMIRAMNLESRVTSADYPALRTTIIDQMAMLKELDKEIKARNLSVTKDEIDATLQEVEASFPTREIFMQQLEQSGLDEKKLRSNIEENMARQKVFDQVLAVASADEKEMRDMYDVIKDYAFQKPEGFMMDVAHFASADVADAAREEIIGGRSWDDIMTADSADVMDFSTSQNRIFIPVDQLVDEVASIKDLPLDQISDVIKLADTDFMIVIKRSNEPAGTASFDEVSADVEQMIVGQKRQNLQSEFLQEMRSRAVVEILDDEIFTTVSPDVTEESAPPEDASSDVTEPTEESASSENASSDATEPAEESASSAENASSASSDATTTEPTETTENSAAPEDASSSAAPDSTSEDEPSATDETNS
jgi:foldase protein PrsA